MSEIVKLSRCKGPTITKHDIKQLKKEIASMDGLNNLSTLLKVLTSESRLKIFYLLSELDELCVCDLADILDLKVSAVSQHLSKLKAYSLVRDPHLELTPQEEVKRDGNRRMQAKKI